MASQLDWDVQQPADWRTGTYYIYGDKGVGKSELAAQGSLALAQAADAMSVYLDLEKGAERIRPCAHRHMRWVQSLDELERRYEFCATPKNRVVAVVLDGVDWFYKGKLLVGVMADKNAAGHIKGKIAQYSSFDPRSAHGVAVERFAELLHRFHELPAAVFILGHAKTWEEDTVKLAGDKRPDWQRKKEDGRLKVSEPDMSPRMKQLLQDACDVVAYAYRTPVEGHRKILCDAFISLNRRIDAKDRTGLLGAAPLALEWNVLAKRLGLPRYTGAQVAPVLTPAEQAELVAAGAAELEEDAAPAPQARTRKAS
jgi:AAA domain-containing protein